MKFLELNDRIVNLQNVSNINILENRIVFNMNYSIELNGSYEKKLISDYVYFNARNDQDMNQMKMELLKNNYIGDNFIKHNNGFVNTNCISSMKFADKKLRTIFNLSHPITFKGNQGVNITSEFVYVNFTNGAEYDAFKTNVKQIILGE